MKKLANRNILVIQCIFKIYLIFLCGTIPGNAKDAVTLTELFNDEYPMKSWNGSWISDNEFIYKKIDGNLHTFNVQTNTSTLIYNVTSGNYLRARYTVSPDHKFILISYNPKEVFRHSTSSQYVIYDIFAKRFHDVAGKKHLQLTKWSSNGSGLAYVLDNNIYYLSSPDKVETPLTVTIDGVPGIIYNGVPDWVYEEEVLSSGSALWFSPNGKYLAFISFNDTKVKDFSYIKYGNPYTFENRYTQVITIKYPKVGTTNPSVVLKVANVQVDKIVLSAIRKPENVDDFIIQNVVWANNEEITQIITNRLQNKVLIYRCHVTEQNCYEDQIIEERRGWLDIKTLIYNSNGLRYLMLLSQPEGDDTFKHIVLFTRSGNETRLTFGKRVITAILGWDEQRDLIYYTSTVIDFPSQQQIYVVNTENFKDRCLSCNFVTPSGVCLYSSAAFSKKYKYWTKICQGRDPHYVLLEEAATDKSIVWEDNAKLRRKLENKLRPLIKDVDVKLESGFVAKARLLIPSDFDETKKYPAVVRVYAGPGSKQIDDKYSMSFPEYFVTNREYINIYIDGRGSGKQGDNIEFSIYRRLGTVEIEDQVAVTKYLQENFPFIDKNRTGIWGWSYGGFSTLWALIKDKSNIFRFGLAVAPVTNYIYYDTIYTERYMGLPTKDDNMGGYNNTNVMANIEALRGKNLFLIHGNADDNVHYQQSMLLAKALERADIPFLQASYPDENHSLGRVSHHFYHTIDRFWARSFGLPDPPRTYLPETS